MPNLLTEWGWNDSAKKWIKSRGTQPDKNDPDFVEFHKQLQAKANNARKAKDDPEAKDNLPKYVELIIRTASERPEYLPKELKNCLMKYKKKEQSALLQAVLDENRLQQPWAAWISLLQKAVDNSFYESATDTVLSALQETISPTTDSKYPWLKPLLNARLSFKEEDVEEPIEAPVTNQQNNPVATDPIYDLDNNQSGDEEFDLDDMDFPEDDMSTGSDSMDDLGGIGGLGAFGGGLLDGGEEDPIDNIDAGAGLNTPQEKIMNVFFDDSGDIMKAKVEVKNMDTNEVYYKDLSEVDIK